MRVCLAGASPEQVHVRLSVVSTGTATVRTGMLGRYLATRRAVEPPLVKTTMSEACTYNDHNVLLIWMVYQHLYKTVEIKVCSYKKEL